MTPVRHARKLAALNFQLDKDRMKSLMNKIKGPQFVQYFGSVLDVLRQLGGSGTPGEVTEGAAYR
jgi:hypothetical protein